MLVKCYFLQLDTGNSDVTIPDIKLVMFPKEAFTAGKKFFRKFLVHLRFVRRINDYMCIYICIYFFLDWMLAFRVVIPLYMVLALSQFITYLLILIVGEKENKIKEGMKIMGLNDSVFW